MTTIDDLLAHQRDLADQRLADQTLIRVEPPPAEWSTGGAWLIDVIGDDRRFLVDTVSMALTELDWSIIELVHPTVVRSRSGQAVEESWITVLAIPPLGADAHEAAEVLRRRLAHGLEQVRQTVADWLPMVERARTMATELLQRAHDSSDTEGARSFAETLLWFAEEAFVFMGARDHEVVNGEFRVVPGSGLGVLRGCEPMSFHATIATHNPREWFITKDSERALVHRSGLRDYLAIRTFNEAGELVAERCLVGQLATKAYTEDIERIPMLNQRLRSVLELTHAAESSHREKAVTAALSTYPRDELFQARAEQLAEIVGEVAELRERRRVRAFVRRDPWGRFLYVTVYLPRDRYTTAVREQMERCLVATTAATEIDHRTHVTESVLARLFFTLTLPEPIDPQRYRHLEDDLSVAARDWADEFTDRAQAHELASHERGVEYPASYQQDNSPDQGILDLIELNTVTGADDLRLVMYRPEVPERADLRVKVLAQGEPMTLSHAMPLWNSLGLTIVDERPYSVQLRGQRMSIADFGVQNPAHVNWDTPDRQRVLQAFEAAHRGLMEVDQLNELVATAGLTWQQVVVLRTLSRYLQQAGVAYSQPYIAQVLKQHALLTRAIVDLFGSKFDPDSYRHNPYERRPMVEQLARAIEAEIDAVSSLDHDRILRCLLRVVQATVRTNAYQPSARALAIKLAATEVDFLPKPRPAWEVFVHSPRLEGVHLRFGAVARGGLRWSDRAEDFRTEVLGLVKAQMVKNTVIVPVGAKGGFVARQLPAASDRAAWLAEGQQCYQIFVSSLLDITDNVIEGQVVPPDRVVRHDADDTYLVVAADKGTATFSDLANQIALERGFWLGDGFASGGSRGYDHKAMGITARGAWESVTRHLAELGLNSQTDDFTCVGIGDMAGDVFGNGMLLSEHIGLVAAFNHQHIFIDPTPDCAVGYTERRRLFELAGSSWADYNPALISAGGGVFDRSAKQVVITAEMKSVLGLADEVVTLTPTELIRAVLLAPVDLLWNGGIGTYVKAVTETHAEVGDRANDAVRVNGGQLRCRVIGEGGNLGLTQKGRIEYARQTGGRVNTDFIDNSAGVDTSDHEVNLKIVLAQAIEAGVIDVAERDRLLPTMTDEIARLVLMHNIDQNLALANARSRAAAMSWVHESLMRHLETTVGLDRELEGLPQADQMQAIVDRGEALSNPELCSLMAWTKIWLEREVLASDLPDDPFLERRLRHYFPQALRERFAVQIDEHPLRREIITTVAVNRFVNSAGISAGHRLAVEAGVNPADVIRAQLAARTLFGAGRYEVALAHTGMDPQLQLELRLAVRKLVERGTRWLLLHRAQPIDIAHEIDTLSAGVSEIQQALPVLLTARGRELRTQTLRGYLDRGADPGLAEIAANARSLHLGLAMIEVATTGGHDLQLTAATFVELIERLGLDDLLVLVEELPRSSEWDVQARSAIRDDLLQVQTDLTARALEIGRGQSCATAVVDAWAARVPNLQRRLDSLHQAAGAGPDLARMSVALRLVRGMVDASGSEPS